jgi:hypothetical protein
MFKWLHSALVFFLVTSIVSQAQEVTGNINLGYSTFSLNSFKEFQHELANSYPVGTKVVDAFPGYLNYSAGVQILYSSFYFGILGGHTSTGGRISYADYSGYIKSDQLISANYLGSMIAKKIFERKKLCFYVGADVLNYFNKVVFKEVDQVGSKTNSSQLQFHSSNLAFGGFIELQRRSKKIIFKSNVGWELQLSGDLKFDGNSNQHLVNSSGQNVKINTGGLRTSIGIGYLFTQGKQQ